MKLFDDKILETANAKEIYRLFGNFQMIAGSELKIRIPQRKILRQSFLNIMALMQYKYCIPFKFVDDHSSIYLSKFSTYKFLNLIRNELKIGSGGSYAKHIDSIINGNCPYTKAYASGGIEKAPQGGTSWRRELKEVFKYTPVSIIDPCDFEYNKTGETLENYKNSHSTYDLYWYAKNAVRNDINQMLSTEFVIVYLDQYVGTGTSSECTVAQTFGFPIYGIISPEFDLKKMSPWTLSTITRFFDSYSQLREFILQ